MNYIHESGCTKVKQDLSIRLPSVWMLLVTDSMTLDLTRPPLPCQLGSDAVVQFS